MVAVAATASCCRMCAEGHEGGWRCLQLLAEQIRLCVCGIDKFMIREGRGVDYAKNAYICVQISNAKNMWTQRVNNKTL
jgi:hypothetical protein